MTTLIIKSNTSRTTPVLIADMGILIPAAGGSETFSDKANIDRASRSKDLRSLTTDDAFGAGSSTLILNDSTNDIAQGNTDIFLSNAIVTQSALPFGVNKSFFGSSNNDIGTAFLQTNSTNYQAVAQFLFIGSSNLSVLPDSVKAIAHNEDGGSNTIGVRLFDVTNALTIAEAPMLAVSITPTIFSLGAVSNLPPAEAIFEIQLKTSSSSNKARLSSLSFSKG